MSDMFKPIGDAAEALEGVRPANDAADDGDGGDGGGSGGGGVKTTSINPGEMMALRSLCVACEDTGVTNMLLTRIPFFRDIILMAFDCEACGYRNAEVQAAEVQERGCRFELRVTTAEDLNRQIVKSDRASVVVPELDFEIPAITQRGVFTTVEGLLDRAIENLESSQPARRAVDPSAADAVEAFLVRLRGCRHAEAGSLPFTLVLDDPSGNSFVENPLAPKADAGLRVRYYVRTEEQSHAMGMYAESAGDGVQVDAEGNPIVGGGGGSGGGGSGVGGGDEDGDTSTLTGSAAQTLFPVAPRDLSGNEPSRFHKGGALIRGTTANASLTRRRAGAVRSADGRLESLVFDSSNSDAAKEVMRFPTACFTCSAPGECRMCVTDVPHFKEVILMAFACDECGWKDVEVKGGGAMPPMGTVTELRYDPTAPEADRDMTRDVIKSDTAAVEIPEIELLMEAGSLGGMYTTVEGLLAALLDKLLEGNPFLAEAGDSAQGVRAATFAAFVTRLTACRDGATPFTLVLRDPLANSWVYSPVAPAPDPRLTHAAYARSEEENISLGLLDMKTEGYGEDAAEGEEEGAGGGGGGGEGGEVPAPEAPGGVAI